MSTLHKKAFSEAPVKCVFLYGSDNSYCAVLGNVTFGEIKDYNLTAPFQKKFIYEGFGLASALHNKVFSGA